MQWFDYKIINVLFLPEFVCLYIFISYFLVNLWMWRYFVLQYLGENNCLSWNKLKIAHAHMWNFGWASILVFFFGVFNDLVVLWCLSSSSSNPDCVFILFTLTLHRKHHIFNIHFLFVFTLLVHLQLHIRILKELRTRVTQIIQLWVSFCFKSGSYILLFNFFVTRHFAFQIFVGGLDSSISDDHLRQVFSQYGELVHVKIPVGKRCGFVQFADR